MKVTEDFEWVFTPTHEDGGGSLALRTRTKEAAVVWLNSKQRSGVVLPEEYLSLKDGVNSFEVYKPHDRDNKRCFPAEISLPGDFAQPYQERFLSTFGKLPEPVELIEFEPWSGISPTHILESVLWDGETFKLFMYLESRDWNGRKSKDRVNARAGTLMLDNFAKTVIQREYIELPNGFYKKNPKWGVYDPDWKPGIEAKWVLEPMMRKLIDGATPGQKEAVARHEACYKGVCSRASLFDVYDTQFDMGLRVSWGDPPIPWEEFQKL